MQTYEKYYYIYYISLLLCLSILIIKLKNLSDFFQSIDTNTVYYDYLLQSELKKTGKAMFCTKCSIFLFASDLKQDPLNKLNVCKLFLGKG